MLTGFNLLNRLYIVYKKKPKKIIILDALKVFHLNVKILLFFENFWMKMSTTAEIIESSTHKPVKQTNVFTSLFQFNHKFPKELRKLAQYLKSTSINDTKVII